jgi:hypothetical protein
MGLAEVLQDPLRTSQLKEMHLEVHSKSKAMELNKNVLEDTLSKELRAIQWQREELDRREKELVAKVLHDDGANKALVGSLLEESVKRIFDEETTRLAGVADHAEGSQRARDGWRSSSIRQGRSRYRGSVASNLVDDPPRMACLVFSNCIEQTLRGYKGGAQHYQKI